MQFAICGEPVVYVCMLKIKIFQSYITRMSCLSPFVFHLSIYFQQDAAIHAETIY